MLKSTGIGVFVGVAVGVSVGVEVGVSVGVFVGVLVGVDVGVFVGVLVEVAVGVFVTVDEGIFVGVEVDVGAAVGVGVDVLPGADVLVAAGFEVDVTYTTNVDVDVQVEVGVFVAITGIVAVAVAVFVLVGIGVLVLNVAPGVRNDASQEGGVRIAGSTGAILLMGMFVRKSLFGLSFDPILVSSFQRGEKRTAHCPATITHRNPRRMISRMMIQSRRSFSRACIAASIGRESYVDRCTRICRFVITGAFQPDSSAVGVDDAARNRQSQPRTATLKLGLAGGVQQHFARLIELLEYKFLVLRIDAYALILNRDLHFRF